MTSAETARAAIRDLMPQILDDLQDLIRIPSISSKPEHDGDTRRSAEAVADLLRAEGCPDVQVLTIDGGKPAVLGRFPAPEGAPTVLLYAHHDVQPVGTLEFWESDPFEPQIRGERLYGRGSSDDKGGIAAHLAAIRAHRGFGGLPVGVTVLIEGEEEIGSPTLDAFLQTYRDLLAADVIVIADSGNWEVGTPALTTTLRGLAELHVQVRTLDHAVHSGMWGGVVPDALTTLMRLLSSLHSDDGSVAVQGLVANAGPDLEYPEHRWRAESTISDGVEPIGSGSIVERLWHQPAISTLAIDAPRVADASNILIPVASAKVSARLAPGQDPNEAARLIREHLEANLPWPAQLTITDGNHGAPITVDVTGPTADLARECLREAWRGTESVEMGVGGSIPFIASFQDAFPHAQVLVTAVGDPDSRAHGENEGLHLGDFENACVFETLLLGRLASSAVG